MAAPRVRRTIGGREFMISRKLNDLAQREGLQFNPDTSITERPQASRAAKGAQPFVRTNVVRQARTKGRPPRLPA